MLALRGVYLPHEGHPETDYLDAPAPLQKTRTVIVGDLNANYHETLLTLLVGLVFIDALAQTADCFTTTWLRTRALKTLAKILSSTLISLKMKRQIVRHTELPVAIYGAETWPLSSSDVRKQLKNFTMAVNRSLRLPCLGHILRITGDVFKIFMHTRK